jgi:hypothetical protein
MILSQEEVCEKGREKPGSAPESGPYNPAANGFLPLAFLP